ncbi:hypothetical protein DTO195F2_7839 [Paecilomyces variotii]|nr:hypothetical protein DTO195F2_7839 [Paecilomyces variotii]
MDDKLDSSDTPRLILELDGASTIWMETRNENYSIRVSLRRILSDELDGRNDNTKDLNQPCWLCWSPEIDPGREDFILLRHDLDSFQRIGVEEKPRYEVDSIIQQFPNEPPSCYTAEAKKSHDRCKITYKLSFPDTWEKLLQLGYTYDLLWTGKEITHWDWSTQPEIKDEPKWPPILVPGGAHITTFTVKEGKRPPIPRPPTPPLIQASERVPGAPVLSLELSCSPIMTLTGSLDVHIKVIYHGVSNNNNTAISKEAQPITFHIHAFDPVYGEFRVYRRRCLDQSRPETEEEWETFEGDDFWPIRTMTADGYGLPDDLKPGERLRYQFKGNTLDWWNWGTAVAHTQTFVTLPGSEVEPISDPKDNGGRPEVVIPASKVVEWTVVDE